MTKWIRSGECCRCGECCQNFNPWESASKDIIAGSIAPERTVANACPLFAWQEREGFCRGHQKHPVYMKLCKDWPRYPNDIKDFPSCTYSFQMSEELAR